MKTVYLVLFDIDGTLLDSRKVGREAMKRAMEEVYGTSGPLHRYNMAGKSDRLTLRDVLTAAGLSEAVIWERFPLYRRAFAKHLEALLQERPPFPLPGARDLVTRLSQRGDVILGLVTGNIPEGAHLKLRYAGFDPSLFRVGAYGSDALERDELPRLALERARSSVPDVPESIRVVVIGDTPLDIQSGHRAGARTVAVSTGPYSADTLAAFHPHVLLPNLADVSRAEAAILS